MDRIPYAEDITQRAVVGTCQNAMEAVAVFCRLLGTVASNLALTLNARGGVYLAGGILPRILPYFRESDFRKRFEEKGRFKATLEAIPTFVVVHPTPAFVGLAHLISKRSITPP